MVSAIETFLRFICSAKCRKVLVCMVGGYMMESNMWRTGVVELVVRFEKEY
jgi:hypothetical protein